MDVEKIGKFIAELRKEKGLKQSDIAEYLQVTDKAVSRWETGKGTPDISFLIPLSKCLDVSISELLNGEKGNTVSKREEEMAINIITYSKNASQKNKMAFRISILLYIVSFLFMMYYLKLAFNPLAHIKYFTGLILVICSMGLIYIGSSIIANHYIEKKEEQTKLMRYTISVIFFLYIILMFNMVLFARTNDYSSVNFIPFKTIINYFDGNHSPYSVIINVFGNLFIYMPFAFFVPFLWDKINNLRKITLFMLITCTIIEILQLILKCGVCDIDDLILNISGVILMYLFLKISKIDKLIKKAIYN